MTRAIFSRRLTPSVLKEILKIDRPLPPVEKRDELDDLVLAFNEIRESLQHAHDDLENRVVDRTKELTISNQRLQSILGSANQGVLV